MIVSIDFTSKMSFEFSHNTQRWQYWHLIQIHLTTFKERKRIQFFPKILTHIYREKYEFFCIFTLRFGEILIPLHPSTVAWCIWIKCHYCQLCVLRENSIVHTVQSISTPTDFVKPTTNGLCGYSKDTITLIKTSDTKANYLSFHFSGVSKCRSCCRTDLCNIGDTSSTVFHATTVTTVMLATLCIIYIVT